MSEHVHGNTGTPKMGFRFYGVCRRTGQLRTRMFYANVTHPYPGPVVRRRAEALLVCPRLMSAGLCTPERRERAVRYSYESAALVLSNSIPSSPGR